MGGKNDLPFLPTSALHGFADDAPALADDANPEGLTYGAMREAIRALAPSMVLPVRDLVMVCAPRSIAGVIAYLAALESGHAVLMADPVSPQLPLLAATYQPAFILVPHGSFDGYEQVEAPCAGMVLMRRVQAAEGAVHPDFALMLLTSGSTGSPKGVRLSYANIAANTRAIIKSLSLTGDEVACGHLPLAYSFGLSVLHTTLATGGRIVLSDESLMSGLFWKHMAAGRVSFFPGVPYHFEMLMRLGLDRLKVPDLTLFAQAGGKMPIPLTQRTLQAVQARAGRLYIMYGQTEASPRMTCFPLHERPDKIGSVGLPLDGGSVTIEDGEVIYRGPNVMMGHATHRADLATGDVCGGRLATGDVGRIDGEGFLTLSGRSQRFAKLYGQRVALDDLERIAAQIAFCAALEHPEKAVLFAARADDQTREKIRAAIVAATKLPAPWIEVRSLDSLPLKQNGKIDYQALQTLVNAA